MKNSAIANSEGNLPNSAFPKVFYPCAKTNLSNNLKKFVQILRNFNCEFPVSLLHTSSYNQNKKQKRQMMRISLLEETIPNSVPLNFYSKYRFQQIEINVTVAFYTFITGFIFENVKIIVSLNKNNASLPLQDINIQSSDLGLTE